MSQTAPLPLLLDPEALEAHLDRDNLVVVQVCSHERFVEGHIPGARFLSPHTLRCDTPPLPHTAPTLAQIETLCTHLGIHKNTWVVALDDEGGGWAGRFLWTLSLVGHNNWSLLNGGLWAWSGAELPLVRGEEPAFNDSRTPQTSESLFPLNWAEDAPTVTIATIAKNLNSPNWVIWDARSAEEYAGIRHTAQRNGHIPGAKHYEWTRAMDRERFLRLRPLDTVKAELAALGITGDKTIITHCQTHHRSGFTWVLGKILGFPNMKAYPGSWSEWGNTPNAPISTDTSTSA